MLRNTWAFLNTHPAVLHVEALTPKVAALGRVVARLDRLADVQTMPTEGDTVERRATFEALTNVSLAVAGPLLSYARSHGLIHLASLADVSRKDFRLLRQDLRAGLAQRIYNAAQPLQGELQSYGITAGVMQELHDCIARVKETTAASRGLASDKCIATLGIKQALAEGAELLGQIDPLVLPLRWSNPDFHARYCIARRVFQRGGARRRRPETGDAVTASGGAAQSVAAAA